MLHCNKKGEIGLPLALVITLIIFLAVVAINILLGVMVKEKYDDTELLNCKLSIDLAQGIRLEEDFVGLTGSIQPIAIECEPIIIDNSQFKDAKDDSAIARIILDKMRISWWATGRGNYKNVWNDILAEDNVCKAMYYFRLEDYLSDEGISKSRFLVHLENDKLPLIDASLADYMQSTPGLGNKYYIATDDEGIKKGKIYAVFISSSTDGFNSVILAEVVPDSIKLTKENINRNIKDSTIGNRVVCSEMVGFGNKLQRFGTI